MTTEKLRTKTESKTTKLTRVRAPRRPVAVKPIKDVKKKTLKLPVIIKPGETGYFVAEIPFLPGCLSQGKTREDALANVKEAAELYLETVGKSLPSIPKRYVTEVEVTI